MICCYLINLDRSPDRLAHFMKQVAGSSLDVIRVSAVDGDDLHEAEKAHWQARCRLWSPLSDAEIACVLSHRKVWKMILERGEPWAFVAEDDVHVSDNFHRFLRRSDWFPPDADLVKAETTLERVEMSSRTARTAHGHKLRRLTSEHKGSAGYFVSRNGAEALLQLTEDVCEPLDRILFSPQLPVFSRFPAYQIDPAICIQDHRLTEQDGGNGFGSDIPWGNALAEWMEAAGPKRGPMQIPERVPKRKGFAKLRHELARPLFQIATLLKNADGWLSGRPVSRPVSIRVRGKNRRPTLRRRDL